MILTVFTEDSLLLIAINTLEKAIKNNTINADYL